MGSFIRYLTFLLAFNCIYADWDPEYCLPDDDISVLEDLVFKNMKENMIQYLKGTWCSEEKVRLLMDLVYVTQPRVCVEIGVLTGSSILPVAATLAYLEQGSVMAIDAWSNAIAIRNMDLDDPNRAWWSTVDMEGAYKLFESRLSLYGLINYCDVIREDSKSAAKLVEEIDFLHLDGDYTEKGSLEDVQIYLPKVKPGGYILLSNLFVMVKGKAPKMKAFSELFDACEMVCEIDRDNVVLFKKN